jgi:hypothetical protein
MSDYEAGQWNVVCARCGFEYKARQLRKEWTGVRTCHGPGTNDCWDPKHPQLSVKGKADRQAPPWVQPEAPDIDVSPGSGNEVEASDL